VAEAAAAGDVVVHVRADRAFHAALLELAGNPVLTETVLRLRDRSRLYGSGDGDGDGVLRATLEQAAAEHYLILERVAVGDGQGARAATAEHVRHVRREWSPAAPS
jgi:DNA-binding GntR family transcriptional regulator